MIYGSVCSGIEAATVAWHPLGWRPSFFSEIDPFPRSVLAHHYPDTACHGDFTTISEDDYAAIDVLVGGTPCQSFSVAGLRAGLDDQRGNLALEFCRLACRLGPKWVVWENVPGVLSLDGGRAFASILGGLAECGYGLAYRVLDAQYVRVDGFGRAVPQRRRRVFVVGHLGDWRRAAAVLFERQGLRWDTPPRREAGQNAAPTLAARTQGGGGLGTDFDCDGGLIANALTAHGSGVGGPDLEHARSNHLVAFGGNNTDGPIEVATACRAKGGTGHGDFESETFVAHSLRAEGFDASEVGTGRGTPLAHSVVPIQVSGAVGANGAGIGQAGDPCMTLQAGIQHAIAFDETQITSAENRSQPKPGDPSHPLAAGARPPTIAFSAKDYGADALHDLSPTLRAGGGHDKSHANAGVMPAIAFNARQDPDVFNGHAGPIDTDGSTQAVLSRWRVRRLTPTECERLQGFPDGYTAIPYRGKPAADGPKYKALGNSMAVNVMRWIGRRIEMVEEISVEAA